LKQREPLFFINLNEGFYCFDIYRADENDPAADVSGVHKTPSNVEGQRLEHEGIGHVVASTKAEMATPHLVQ